MRARTAPPGRPPARAARAAPAASDEFDADADFSHWVRAEGGAKEDLLEPKREEDQQSQGGQDRFLWERLFEKADPGDDGFFVEFGALTAVFFAAFFGARCVITTRRWVVEHDANDQRELRRKPSAERQVAWRVSLGPAGLADSVLQYFFPLGAGDRGEALSDRIAFYQDIVVIFKKEHPDNFGTMCLFFKLRQDHLA